MFSNNIVNLQLPWSLVESLNDEEDFPTSLPVGDLHAFHDFGGHVAQADRRGGLWVRQQREGLRIVHAGTNEELDVIAESMDLLWGQTSALERVEATAVSTSPAGLTTMTDALSAKARKPSPGLEGVEDLASDPRFAAVVPTTPLSPDAAYIGHYPPAAADHEEGRNGYIRM